MSSVEEIVSHVERVAGVLEALPRSPTGVDEIARLCKLEVREVKDICDFLCGRGYGTDGCRVRSVSGYAWIENERTNQ
jgi:hypothetical protein